MNFLTNYPLGHAFALAALLLLVPVGALLAKVPAFRTAVESGGGRFVALDGLRGFLALAVVFHHASCYVVYWTTGKWDRMVGPYESYGPLAVNVFFLITGFLFWSKAIKAKGRIEPIPLLVSRVRRLVPLYAFLACLSILAAAIESRGHLQAGVGTVARQLVETLSMGVYSMSGVNGSHTSMLFGEATWTLWWEWRFYLLLPVIAGAAAVKGGTRWLVLLAPFAFFRFDPHVLAFILGIACAYLVDEPRLAFLKNRHLGGAVILMGVVLGLSVSHDIASSHRNYVLSCLCAFPILLPILMGNDIWGLLSRPGARYLGGISYSIYLLHCAVLFFAFRAIGMGTGTQPPSASLLMVVVGIALLALVGVASLTFRYIEHPFMRSKEPRTPFPPTADPEPSVEKRDVEKETEGFAL